MNASFPPWLSFTRPMMLKDRLLLLTRAWLVLAVVLVCGLAQWLDWREILHFDRARIAAGEWWLLLSGHFVHASMPHYVMNMAALILIAVAVGRHFNDMEWIFVTLVSALCVGLGLYVFAPELRWYVGFSGVLNGILLAGGWRELKVDRLFGTLLLALLLVKLGYEQWQGPMPGSEETVGGRVIVDAHLYGAIGGALALLPLEGWRRLRPERS